MIVSQIISVLDEIAPPYLKMSYDKVGLQVGGRKAVVDKILVTLEITDGVIDEAIEKRANLIISHHPLIFRSLDRIIEDDHIGSLIAKLIKADIGVLVAHTNLDRAAHGVNAVLAGALDLQNIEILEIAADIKMNKIVVFAPKENIQAIINAAAEAGAGIIGDYSYCSFRAEGIGTFVPGANTNPYIGKTGMINEAHELRLEMVVTPNKVNAVVEAILKNHPYEEVAYDVYELNNSPVGVGMGRIGDLSEPKPLKECVDTWEKGLSCRMRVAGNIDKIVKRVAVCGGSGSSLIGMAKAAGADVLITGDVKHHEAHAALESGLAIVDAGHAETERLVVPELAKLLRSSLADIKSDVEVIVSKVDTSPWNKRD
ncbi:MAG: Nif3-like dinuclear metal center hexameric protein [Rubrobacteridae bacterium]|nr:Nif3-like dinuclear metal center hexameric protein [Rubrobacteridae bacterium]